MDPNQGSRLKDREKIRQNRRALRQKFAPIKRFNQLKKEVKPKYSRIALKKLKAERDRAELVRAELESEKLRAEIAQIKSASEEPKSITIKIDYYLDLLVRRRWLLIIPFLLFMIGGMFVAVTAPRIYQATTLILVEPKSIPDKYVEPLTEVTVKERVSTITQQLKSRTYIERVIKEAELFSGPQFKNMLAEVQVEAVRRNMKVEVTRGRRGADSFTISYRGADPEKITKAVNILAGYFIDESIKVMTDEVLAASDFLQEELKAKADQLIAVENALKEYRMHNMGGLPEQLGSNLKILQGLYARLDQKEKSLREEKSKLIQLKKQMSHEEIREVQKTIKNYEEDIAELLNRINYYEKFIEDTPKREWELLSVTRDYEHIKDSYKSLLTKKLDADIAVSMEKKSKGQRFRVLDLAKAPKRPVSPDIRKLLLMSIVAGLGIGGGLILLLDFLDTSLRRPEDIEDQIGVPVLATVPNVCYRPIDKIKQRLDLGLSIVFIMVDFWLFCCFGILAVKGLDEATRLLEKIVNKLPLL
jgi:uncharacterized protein involved in exopolysaccharide biosynthesis